MDSFKSKIFSKNKLKIILLYFFVFSLSETTNEQSNRLYPKMIDLPNDKFLFVIVDGIYIFESNLLDKDKIFNFEGQQIINNVEDMNKTTLSDITYNDNLYIFCLVKDYLYLFDNNKKKIIKELNLNSYLNGKTYCLNPFINGTYLSCIISYTEKTSYPIATDDINILNIYGITFLSVNENDQNFFISKREYFNKTYVESKGASYISKPSSTCQISSNILYCFYFVEDSKKIRVSLFNLLNNYEEINNNFIFSYNNQIELYEIKSFSPFNSSLILLCYYVNYYESSYSIKTRVFCISYKIQQKKLYVFDNNYYYDCDNFQPYYFIETNEFVLGCNNYKKLVKAFLFDKYLADLNDNYLDPLICNDIYNYLIYYNSTSKEYNIITDCYINNNDSFILSNHTLFIGDNVKNDKRINYIIPSIEQIEFVSEEHTDLNDDILSYYLSTTNEDNSDNNADVNENTNNGDNSSSDFSSINKDNSDNNENNDENTNNGDNSSSDSSSTNKGNSDNNENIDENTNNGDNSSSDSSSINKDNSDNNENIDENTNNGDNSSSDSSSTYSQVITEQTDIIELNISKNEVIDNISNILNKTEIGENYEINGKDFNLIIKPTNSTSSKNSTHVNFQNCEDILRSHYNISNSTILTFIQLETKNNDENSLINSIEYEVYDDNKNLLNLSVYNNT